jgi:hypothetical protein
MSRVMIEVGSARPTVAHKRGSLRSGGTRPSKQTAQHREIRRIAHDFNNLLTLVMGHGEAMLLSLPKDHPLQSDAEEIVRAAVDAARLLPVTLWRGPPTTALNASLRHGTTSLSSSRPETERG